MSLSYKKRIIFEEYTACKPQADKNGKYKHTDNSENKI
jgi:hypothetical protein